MEDLRVFKILKNLEIPDNANVYVPDNEALDYAANEFRITTEMMLSSHEFIGIMQDCVNPQDLEIWKDGEYIIVEDVILQKSVNVGNITFHIIEGLLVKSFKLRTLKWFDQR
jgi:hypothetical protein